MPAWTFLLHRLPREPSAPRIALWRALRRLGAVLLGDGLVALPASDRTIEHFEWLAAGILESGGNASVWTAVPTSRSTSDSLAAQSRDSVDAEYRALLTEAEQIAQEGGGEPRVALQRLRRRLREVAARDFFGAPSAPRARAAVESLAKTGELV